MAATPDFVRFVEIVLAQGYSRYIKQAELVIKNSGESVVTLFDAEYPALLKEIDYAPFAFFTQGNRELLRRELVSIVGTREPSYGGRLAAACIAEVFAARRNVVVSGIARGIDAIAHHSALKHGGATIAVLPNGFAHLYPLENRDIYAQSLASDRVLLVSEYAPDQKPQRHHFVRRNRIIAGLTPLTIFVEGAEKSGGMITVNYAADYGREVAALQHPLLANNTGGERLIADGASDVTPLVSEYLFAARTEKIYN